MAVETTGATLYQLFGASGTKVRRKEVGVVWACPEHLGSERLGPRHWPVPEIARYHLSRISSQIEHASFFRAKP